MKTCKAVSVIWFVQHARDKCAPGLPTRLNRLREAICADALSRQSRNRLSGTWFASIFYALRHPCGICEICTIGSPATHNHICHISSQGVFNPNRLAGWHNNFDACKPAANGVWIDWIDLNRRVTSRNIRWIMTQTGSCWGALNPNLSKNDRISQVHRWLDPSLWFWCAGTSVPTVPTSRSNLPFGKFRMLLNCVSFHILYPFVFPLSWFHVFHVFLGLSFSFLSESCL